jgi:hypothetical protein
VRVCPNPLKAQITNSQLHLDIKPTDDIIARNAQVAKLADALL